MVSNAAHNLANNSRETEKAQQRQLIVNSPKGMPVSWAGERWLLAICGAIMMVMMVCLVTSKIDVTNANHQLQNVQAKVNQVSNSNANERQLIAQLTSESNLNRAANKYGFTDANTSVRNVNK
ncbi:FtsB/FtsL family cell division protein [Limosilactobacillus difficilis]|uniref:cell division protein FtsL n=1 Tax=Limosilactobacillus difficilis TaxID=2991838 RepID=UPI0024B965EC|nr:cell division protein FtsL [Limosilactobacillus difficilis]